MSFFDLFFWGHPIIFRWVTEELVLETTPDSLILKEELDKKVTGNKPYPKRKTPRKPQADKALDQTPDNQPPNILDPNRKFRMKLSLPPTLKQALERDFVNVTLRNLLIKLPRNPNIETILSSFVKSHTELHPTGDTKSLQDFVDGIITCFDFTLPLQLLYKEERSQLEREGFTHSGSRIKRQNIISDQGGVHVMYPGYTSWGTDTLPGPIKPSLIYGAEHLLRLFVKLPELFDHLEPEYLTNFTYFCQTFLDYVAKNRAEVFVEIQPYKEAELCDLGWEIRKSFLLISINF